MSDMSSARSGLLDAARSRRAFLRGAVLATGALLLDRAGLGGGTASAQPIGPSTTVDPYVLPSVAGVKTTAILTVGDLPADNGYRMVGIPDGLGAYPSGDDTFTVLMNHELAATAGGVRAHGSKGAFVSKWTIQRSTLRVLSGEDLTPSPDKVYLWNAATKTHVQGTTAWNRHCSGDLPARKALRHGNRGASELMYFNGEEVDDDGRAWARIVTGAGAGQAWELPRLGKISWENAVACPGSKDKTVIVCLDDGDLSTSITANRPCELYVYIGQKQESGSPVERAGLMNGKLYGARLYRGTTLVTEESDELGLGDSTTGYVGSARLELVELGPDGDVSSMTAAELQAEAKASNIARLRRTEDGAWDARSGRHEDFYFVTTADFNTKSRLWRVRFNDIDDPESGGRIDILLGGPTAAPFRQLDNICIDRRGRVLMQEDPGNQAHLAKIWLYGIESGQLSEVAHHNPRFFLTGSPDFMTQDEESSGIIDAQDILGRGWFLLNSQSHKVNPDPELVQYGQLLAMYVDPQIGRNRGDDDEDDHG